MNNRNDLEIMKVGFIEELDLLNTKEQSNTLGGDKQVECQKGYDGGNWFSEPDCECGYKSSGEDAPEEL